MTTSDLNGDGHPDLVIGSPFAPEGGEQRGFIAGYMASKENFGEYNVDFSSMYQGLLSVMFILYCTGQWVSCLYDSSVSVVHL